MSSQVKTHFLNQFDSQHIFLQGRIQNIFLCDGLVIILLFS